MTAFIKVPVNFYEKCSESSTSFSVFLGPTTMTKNELMLDEAQSLVDKLRCQEPYRALLKGWTIRVRPHQPFDAASAKSTLLDKRRIIEILVGGEGPRGATLPATLQHLYLGFADALCKVFVRAHPAQHISRLVAAMLDGKSI